jgi:hypothetical protein
MPKETEPVRGTHELERADRETSQNAKKTEQVGGTHVLKSGDGGTSQSAKRNGASKGLSRPGERRWRDESECHEKRSEEGAFTCWRVETGTSHKYKRN